MTLATRMAVMRGGVIQQIGTPAQIYAKPMNLFVATFLGSPPMNLLKGHLERREDGMWFRHPHFELDVSHYPFRTLPDVNTACVLGIRPEDVKVGAGRAYQGTVSLVEPMGNHRVIWVDYHGAQIASIVQDKMSIGVDEVAAFSLDREHVSLFDEAGGTRL
jgi:multiple sugar transport system ATP-binding protein